MPQQTLAAGTSVATSGGSGLAPAWTNLTAASVQLDDNNRATTAGFTSLASPSKIVNSTAFGLLAEDAANGVLSGIKIPAGASIVGVRFIFAIGINGGTPTCTCSWLAGTSGAFNPGTAANTDVVRSFGYGTLSTGSTSALGNTWGSNDLSTTAGQAAARAALAQGLISASVQFANSNAVSNATPLVDMVQILVEWVIRADITGGAKTGAKAGGQPRPLVTSPGGGKTSAKAGGQPRSQVTVNPIGAKTSSSTAGGQPRPLTTIVGGAKTSSSTAGGAWRPILTAPGGAKVSTVAGGQPRPQVTVPGGAKTGATAGGQPRPLVTISGGAKTGAKAGGQPRPAVNWSGGAKATTSAGGQPRPLVTVNGGAKTGAKAGTGPITIVSYAIPGYVRSPVTDQPIQGARVDVYRTADHAHMGRVFTDVTGLYTVAIPYVGNETATFWARTRLPGTSPRAVDCTDEDLTLVQTVVQTV